MKKVAVATNVPFWRFGAGLCSRMIALLNYLSRHTQTTAVFGGAERDDDADLIKAHQFNFEIVYLEKKGMSSIEEYSIKFSNYVSRQNIDVCIIEYLDLSFLLNYLPRDIRTILDTHDIISDRIKSFAEYNFTTNVWPSGTVVKNEAEEYDVFNSYDAIMLINNRDFDKVGSKIGYEKVILAPHPPAITKRAIRQKAVTIGYVASNYTPNVHAIISFITDVWPSFIDQGLTLNIYGTVGTKIDMPADFLTSSNICIRGFVQDLNQVYDEIDIVINPVKFGAGLKIKNMEALGSGLPLITTSHGATGIEAGSDQSFLIADTNIEFIKCLTLLSSDLPLRRRLSGNAISFIQDNFSEDKCFSSLVAYINAAE
jgi:glycosyltransferase involved in cell wall biosynthesis